jgi:[ribosomal protein S18]-alanine N-acetyltransferase
MHDRCRAHAGAILVAEVDEAVAGLAMALTGVPPEALDEPPGDYAPWSRSSSCAGYRRQGLGAALLRAAEAMARDAGASELRIGVVSGTRAVRRLYRRAGFGPNPATLAKPLPP